MRNCAAQTTGKGCESAEVGAEHFFNVCLDLPGQHRGSTLGANGDDHRVTIDERRRRQVTQIGLIHDIHRAARLLRERVNACVEARTPRRHKSHRRALEKGGGDRPLMPMSTTFGDKVFEFDFWFRGGEHDFCISFQDQARFLGGLFTVANDYNAPPCCADEHWEAFHLSLSTSDFDCAVIRPLPSCGVAPRALPVRVCTTRSLYPRPRPAQGHRH